MLCLGSFREGTSPPPHGRIHPGSQIPATTSSADSAETSPSEKWRRVAAEELVAAARIQKSAGHGTATEN